MLALDSINSSVRERLVAAHLAHARKQVPKGRPDLARKELAQAGEWARSAHARTEIDLVAGLIALIEDVETGGPALRELVERLGGGVASYLALALAGEGLSLSLPQLFKQVGLGKPATGGRDDLLAALARLRTYLDGGDKITEELGTYLTPLLTKAPRSELSKSETEATCETLRRCGLYKVRLHVVRSALGRWKGEPLFEFHAFEAKCPRNPDDCSDKDIERLEAALERAREECDTRTEQRLEKLLIFGGSMPFIPPPPAVGPDSLPPGPEALGALIRLLGLDKIMDALGPPPEMQRDLRKLARQQGNEAAAEMLTSVINMASELADLELYPSDPRPPTRKPAKPKRGPSRPTDQLDLF